MSAEQLSVALLGQRFMGRAHSNAWRQAPRFFDLPVEPFEAGDATILD